MRDRERGQVLVEFALILPVVIAIAILTIDVANMITISHRLMHATREGARVATETALPVPREVGSCDIDSCHINPESDEDVCCIGISRGFLVAFNSGVRDPEIEGTWTQEFDDDGNLLVFYTLDAETTVPFFFRSQERPVRASTTSFAHRFEQDDDEEDGDIGGG